ncbi:MAG: hypothetical protein NTZ50_07390 [Chloroflexi bacterium]|nr:hypothetical protein [Chloroflexota bacterium]
MTTEQLRTISPLRLAAVAGVLLLTAALTWLLRDTVREVVVRPLTYLFWFGSLLLHSIPERILLLVLVACCGLLALRSLTARPRTFVSTGGEEIRRGEDPRLEFWRSQFRYAPHSDFAAEKLAAELRILILQMLAHEERHDRDTIMHYVRNGELALPEHVRNLLLEKQMWKTDVEHSLTLTLQRWRAAGRTLLRLPPTPEPPSPFERELEQVIEWMEKKEERRK